VVGLDIVGLVGEWIWVGERAATPGRRNLVSSPQPTPARRKGKSPVVSLDDWAIDSHFAWGY
jgi:hypothetical protein